ncbi:glycosyltransferase 87 family protein [Chloroflexota bacterium]
MHKHRFIQISALGISLSGYIWLGYFTERTDFLQILLLYSVLFALYIFLLYNKKSGGSYVIAIGGAVLLRLSLLLMTPNLSDDYFRYIWDGLLTINGVNPYMLTPAELVNSQQVVPGISGELFQHLNSSAYLSAYPPVSQFIFWLSAKVAGASIFGNIIVIRICVLLAEFGTLTLLHRLATRFKLPPSTILIFALNPLVIIELTGNLHFEAVMIFFLLLAVYLLINERLLFSAISIGLAIGTKLLPLIILPLLIKRLGVGRSIRYYLVTGATVILLFIPFLNGEAISNYLSSLSLYFRVFEFNASVYYLIRWIYFQTFSDTLINVTQVLLPVLTLLAVIIISLKQKSDSQQSIFSYMLFCLTIYFIFTSNVHPWNLTTLVMLSVFTSYRFMIVWSWTVVLTYSAYQTFPYSENLWLVAIEYFLAPGWMAWEIINHHVRKNKETKENGITV